MVYNPYDLVPVVINGIGTYGRPFEFDSEMVNADTMTNGFGQLVKPSKLSVMCSDCGSGFELDVVLGDYPFEPVVYDCLVCNPVRKMVDDPFMNPIDSQRISAHELDPYLHNFKSEIVDDGLTVADRLGSIPATQPEPLLEAEVKPRRNQKKPKKSKKPVKLPEQDFVNISAVTHIQPAEGLTEEQDIDCLEEDD